MSIPEDKDAELFIGFAFIALANSSLLICGCCDVGLDWGLGLGSI